jgi:hypothetical protein
MTPLGVVESAGVHAAIPSTLRSMIDSVPTAAMARKRFAGRVPAVDIHQRIGHALPLAWASLRRPLRLTQLEPAEM